MGNRTLTHLLADEAVSSNKIPPANFCLLYCDDHIISIHIQRRAFLLHECKEFD
jgi:hypothetical protein